MSTTWHDSRFGPGSYEHAAQEDRSAPRQRVNIPATIRMPGGTPLHTVVQDIGAGGFAAFIADPQAEGTTCWLVLPDHEAIKAIVAWCRDGRMGCAFTDLLDPQIVSDMAARYGETCNPRPVR